MEYTLAGLGRLIQRSSDSASGYNGNDTLLNYDGGTAGCPRCP